MDGVASPCKCARCTRKETKCVCTFEGKQHAKTKWEEIGPERKKKKKTNPKKGTTNPRESKMYTQVNTLKNKIKKSASTAALGRLGHW
ncbi:unnamed protein product [Amoebophrya sp. A25]|nr:unnamed protein product [Amoebophrya sp. A25]|eukprot:GSA25T00006495001.1